MPLRQFWCHLVRTLLYYSDKCRDQSELPIKWGSKILTMFFLVWADKNSVVNFFHFTLSAYNLSCLCLRWWQNNQELLLVATLLWRREWHPTPVLLPGKSHGWRSLVGCSPWGREESDMTERLHFHFHALEKEMATHSSVLAWRIPGTGEPGRLPSRGSHRVGHDWSDLAAAAAALLG